MVNTVLTRILAGILTFAIILGSFASFEVITEADNNRFIPEPVKVVDFSYSFDELANSDEEFEVVDNAAKPVLVQDKEMGQVLQLGKAVIKDQEFDGSRNIVADESEYSTIKLSNPYVGREFLKEYEPYEDVKTTEYEAHLREDDDVKIIQPDWEEGITISYWIKSPNAVNSNVVGFTSERFQMQADDYAKHLCTVKFNLEYNAITSEEREVLQLGPSGVLPDSEFYFDYAEYDENGKPITYMDKPLYKAPDEMGRTYWMNKFYEPGYVDEKEKDGTYKESSMDGSYERFAEAPYLGVGKEDHNPGNSKIRYAWTYSEMWLDASSSFYFENDSKTDIQLNPNHKVSYNTTCGMQDGNCFNINSWKGYFTFEEALENEAAAPSPLSKPDQWHHVTVVIQNDWVLYYLDGEKIDIVDNYSSWGGNSLSRLYSSLPWKRFNKGTGSRYGYGNNKTRTYWCFYGGYVSTTMMEWLIMDCTQMTIGGGNRNGDEYNMFADTDEIMLKNVVFYDKMLNDEQIKFLSENPFVYYKDKGVFYGDVDADGKINSNDALLVLKYSAKLEDLDENQILRADVTENKKADAADALEILKYAAGYPVIFSSGL